MLPTLVHSMVVSEFNDPTFFLEEHAVAQLIEALRFKDGRSRVRFPLVSLELFIDTILPAALWPWV